VRKKKRDLSRVPRRAFSIRFYLRSVSRRKRCATARALAQTSGRVLLRVRFDLVAVTFPKKLSILVQTSGAIAISPIRDRSELNN